ncbi:MAG: hypothetical protein WCG25_05285 [bacterium]
MYNILTIFNSHFKQARIKAVFQLLSFSFKLSILSVASIMFSATLKCHIKQAHIREVFQSLSLFHSSILLFSSFLS